MAENRAPTNPDTRSRRLAIKLYSAAIAALIALAPLAARAQSTIAHWTFDTASLTIGGGGTITGAADSTGVHNATMQSTGSGGGCPCTSNAIPGTNSIAGQFAQGLTLTGANNVAGGGGQFLTYPILNELMSANSAPGTPSYTVSYWLRTTTTNGHQFTILSDWGNAATNPGRFTYGYGFQFASGVAQMRGQARFNTSGTGNGTDIYARAVNTASLNDGNWHMLTWTFDTTAGVLTSYFDAVAVETFTSTAASFDMIASSSTVGTFGLKGDSGNFINGTVDLDEVWVFNGVLSDTQVLDLKTNNVIGPPPVPGDTDGDGTVELSDFDPIRANFRKSVTLRTEGDLVRDGIVNFLDFRQWKVAFLGAGGSLEGVDLGFLTGVPEPSTIWLLLMAGCGLFRRARLQSGR